MLRSLSSTRRLQPVLTVNEEQAMPFDGIGYEGRIETLDKVDKVIDLLAREDRWCKQQLRSYDGRRCILGAMMAADATIALKEPILLAIKQVTGRDYLRIEMFNDHPLTTHSLVIKVLHQARENIVNGVVERPMAVAAPQTGTWWSGSLKPLHQLRRIFG
ncbi:MAG TPA: hypothetical protein VN681_13050 [Stellaceae bacterium]|nr:hypothetical protein [Stellaceae bacterium]